MRKKREQQPIRRSSDVMLGILKLFSGQFSALYKHFFERHLKKGQQKIYYDLC